MDFVNEGKLDEEQKRRQAEWERVRKPEDPIEAPPEVFDNRSLYDRLKEQHELKKKEFEDSFALKNQVRGIDVDEANFLSECDEARIRREREIRLQEKKEIEDVKITTSSNTVPAAIPKINLTLPAHKKENKQLELLSSAVMTKRKSHPSSTAATALLKSNDLSKGPGEFLTSDRNISGSSSSSDDEPSSTKKQKTKEPSSIAVVGVLPGIGDYDSNSSSESDSSSEDELNTSEVICRESEVNSAAARLSKS